MANDPEPTAPARVPPLYALWIPLAFTLVSGLLLVLHFQGRITLDSPVITLVGAAVLVWFLPLVTRIKLGENEIELGKRMSEVEMAVRQDAERVDALVDTQIAPEADDDGGAGPAAAEALDPDQAAILLALDHPRYNLRTVTGTRKESGLASNAAVAATLDRLKDKGLVRTVTGKSGTPVWGLTQKGRLAVAARQ
ncbi:hypothetical protein [Marimonas arenosa]|uniref:Uncharacterized protein n=1 Tax=Marimonas arenosa TaxID=1795305 RepID=A0AAE3WDH5_9RHOB|nr:hypothetical protein [Marimonas arenosa]MDQ2090911.1 hypothetical protein [Marimonas arenosa]